MKFQEPAELTETVWHVEDADSDVPYEVAKALNHGNLDAWRAWELYVKWVIIEQENLPMVVALCEYLDREIRAVVASDLREIGENFGDEEARDIWFTAANSIRLD